MSDYYPNGYYPRLTDTPPVWGTPAASSASIVQLNGLVYQKNNRHTGGTGRPDQEVDGASFRTWSLYEPATTTNGMRLALRPLHTAIQSPVVSYDADAYSSTSNYFNDGYTGQGASSSLAATPAALMFAPIPLPNGEMYLGCNCSQVFYAYEPQFSPGTRYVTVNDGVNGYTSPNPGIPGSPGGTPPTGYVPYQTEWPLNQMLRLDHPWFIGRTYTGYFEVLTSTAQWVADPGAPFGYSYQVNAATISEIPIVVTALQSSYEAVMAGTTLPTNVVTHQINGGLDTLVQFGGLVLRSVSPDATN
jgi:hypothetical protein